MKNTYLKYKLQVVVVRVEMPISVIYPGEVDTNVQSRFTYETSRRSNRRTVFPSCGR